MKQGTDLRLYDGVDFRPDWYLLEERNRRISRCYRVATLLMFVVMAGLVGGTWRNRTELSRYHAAQVAQVDGVTTKMTQVQKLEQEQVMLRAQMKVHEALYQPLEYNQVLSVFASYLSESVALREMSMTQRTVQKTRAMTMVELEANRKLKTRRALNSKTVTTEQHVLELEVKAVASSYVVIANLIGDLASSRLFEDVKMLRSEPIKMDNLYAHAFSLRMLIPLNHRYRFTNPDSEVATGVMAPDSEATPPTAPEAAEPGTGVVGVMGGLGHVD